MPTTTLIIRIHNIHVSLSHTISFDHLSTLSSPSLMASLDPSKSTLRNTTCMYEQSLGTAHTDFNCYNTSISMCTTLLSSEGVKDENIGMHPKIERTETPIVPDLKPQVHNVVTSNSNNAKMFAVKAACTMEQMVTKEMSALVPGSLDDILQGVYEMACSRVRSVIHNVIEQVVLDPLYYAETSLARLSTGTSSHIPTPPMPPRKFAESYYQLTPSWPR